MQVATLPPTISTKVALPHSATHSPPERKGVKALVHVRQCVLLGPEHVPHDEWQRVQTPWSACGELGAPRRRTCPEACSRPHTRPAGRRTGASTSS